MPSIRLLTAQLPVGRLAGMPVTRNVAWDGRLESFKGRDTARYVTTAAAIATTCALCRRPLQLDEPLSLSVDITESTAPDGTQYVTFSDYVCHRQCCDPDLTLQRAIWQPAHLTPLAARMILTQRASDTGTHVTVVAALAYTLVPVVAFREEDGELTSALVSILLSHGFELAMNPEYTDILNQATELDSSCSLAVTEGFLSLDIGGETIYAEQLNPKDRDDADWLEAARNGNVLIISGDNLVITEGRLDVDTAAQLGTLVIGFVPLRS